MFATILPKMCLLVNSSDIIMCDASASVNVSVKLDHDRRRQRKNHTKSRYGCRNCKLRRIKVLIIIPEILLFYWLVLALTVHLFARWKCDETRPHCVKCIDYKVRCNYDFRIPDLQMLPDPKQFEASRSETTTAIAKLNSRGSVKFSTSHLHNMNMCLGMSMGTATGLDRNSFHKLESFRRKIACSLGTPEISRLYQTEVPGLAIAVSSFSIILYQIQR